MYFMANRQARQHANDVTYQNVIDNPTQGDNNNENDVDKINRNLQLINIWIGKIKAAALALRTQGEMAVRDAPPDCREHFQEINEKIGSLIANINEGPEENQVLRQEDRPANANLIPLVGGRTRQSGGYLYPTSSSRKSKKSSRNRKKRKNKKSRR